MRDVLHGMDHDRAAAPSTATSPLTRSRSGPRSAVSTAIACSNTGQGSGVSNISAKAVDAVGMGVRVVVVDGREPRRQIEPLVEQKCGVDRAMAAGASGAAAEFPDAPGQRIAAASARSVLLSTMRSASAT